MKIKQCNKCHKNYIIRDNDTQFYIKMSVSEPTLCPDCRQQRRLAWRNEKSLYEDNCDLCGKKVISLYAPGSPYQVYCQDCWWGDHWDPCDYGQEFNFSESFFKQYRELQLKVPRLALYNLNSINSEYTNHSFNNKNCYLGTAFGNCDDCLYGHWVLGCRNCVDGLYIEDSELCYDCLYCQKCYGAFYCEYCKNAKESLLCFECENVDNCIGCVQLRHKQYYVLNKPVTAEKFQEIKRNILTDPEKMKTMQNNFSALKLKAPRRHTLQINSENCVGNDLYNCRNTYYGFNCHNCENCSYIFDIDSVKDSMDDYEHGWFKQSELIYEAHAGMAGYNFRFCNICADSRNLTYCDMCNQNCSDLFGCVCLKKKHFCILNKQYTEDAFNKLRIKIIEYMKRTGEWGEFFPMRLSPFAYNESAAQEYFPLKKEEALSLNCHWQEENQNNYIRVNYAICNDIAKINDDILQKILTCSECGKNYKLIAAELAFYRQTGIPVPKKCFGCRHKKRMQARNPRSLWKAQCMCTKPNHNHQGRCANEFETTYSPERKELVYCEDCYNREIY
jgi:thiol-disulfide isomerase/thioredoxin